MFVEGGDGMEHLYWCNGCRVLTTKKVNKDAAKCDKCGNNSAKNIGFVEHAEQKTEEISRNSEIN